MTAGLRPFDRRAGSALCRRAASCGDERAAKSALATAVGLCPLHVGRHWMPAACARRRRMSSVACSCAGAPNPGWRALGADYAARSEQQALRERPVIAPNHLLPMPPPCRCDDGGKMMIAAARCVKSAGRQTGTEARAWQCARRRTKLHGVGHLSRACDRRAGALWSSKGRSPPVVGLQPYGDRRASPTVSPAISQGSSPENRRASPAVTAGLQP